MRGEGGVSLNMSRLLSIFLLMGNERPTCNNYLLNWVSAVVGPDGSDNRSGIMRYQGFFPPGLVSEIGDLSAMGDL